MIQVLQCEYGSEGFATCFDIRLRVFVLEQDVPVSEERDSCEEKALHYLALADCKPAGTARSLIMAPGVIKIGRVAVLPAYRKSGVGAAVMRAVEAANPRATFVLDAQIHALPFYERLGFVAEGDQFQEAGIPHRRMKKIG